MDFGKTSPDDALAPAVYFNIPSLGIGRLSRPSFRGGPMITKEGCFPRRRPWICPARPQPLSLLLAACSRVSSTCPRAFWKGEVSQMRPSRSNSSTRSSGLVLIVDDAVDEARLTKRTVEGGLPECDARILASGKELLAYLDGEGAYSDRAAHPPPAVILLDLRMPEMDGFETLERLRSRPQQAGAPVVVLTAFDDLANLKRAFSLGARGFLLKPMNLDSFRSILSSLNISC